MPKLNNPGILPIRVRFGISNTAHLLPEKVFQLPPIEPRRQILYFQPIINLRRSSTSAFTSFPAAAPRRTLAPATPVFILFSVCKLNLNILPHQRLIVQLFHGVFGVLFILEFDESVHFFEVNFFQFTEIFEEPFDVTFSSVRVETAHPYSVWFAARHISVFCSGNGLSSRF